MAKRFTDTEKWKDEWWGSLNNDYRMIWLYLVDNCSIAGIWKKDFRGLNFNCNVSIKEEDLKEICGDRLIDRGNYFFIPKFLRFQCPKGLNSNKPAIVSIVKELINNDLIDIVNQSLGNDFLIIKGKDKGKGKDKDKGKEKGEERVQGEKPVPREALSKKEITEMNFEHTWAQAFDKLTLERYRSIYRFLDLDNELRHYRLKCDGDEGDYHKRDLAGLRNGFLHQLKTSKQQTSNERPNQNRKQQHTSKLAASVIEAYSDVLNQKPVQGGG